MDFAKAGLTDPTLVRLDVETKVPDTLKLAFLKTTSESKDCVLLHLLKNVIPKDQQTIVFTATRYEAINSTPSKIIDDMNYTFQISRGVSPGSAGPG